MKHRSIRVKGEKEWGKKYFNIIGKNIDLKNRYLNVDGLMHEGLDLIQEILSSQKEMNKQSTKEWEESLNVDERFSWATKEQRQHILAEIRFQRKFIVESIIKELEGEKVSVRDGDDYDSGWDYGYNAALSDAILDIKKI